MTVPPRRSRRWIWFFLLLAPLGVVAVVVPLVYNLRMQLTPEQVQAARATWETQGPTDYDLFYQERLGEGPVETYLFEIRGGVVVQACQLVQGQRIQDIPLPRTDWQQRTVPRLLERIEQREQAARQTHRSYLTASFDANGCPVRFVHRGLDPETRLEWRAETLPPGKSSQIGQVPRS